MKKDRLSRVFVGIIVLAVSVIAIPFRSAHSEETGPTASVERRRIMTLADAQKRAVADNPEFKSVGETVYRAKMAISQAWTLLLPRLTANASIIRNQQEVAIGWPADPTVPGAAADEIVIQDLWSRSFGFDVKLTLFDPQSIPLIKLAKDEHERALLTAQIERNDILFAVTSAYYQAYSMNEMVDVAQENLVMAEAFLKHTTLLNAAGQATQIDVTRAEIQLLDAKQNVADAKKSKQLATMALKFLIHIEEPFDLADPGTVTAVDGGRVALKRSALEQRMEIKAATAAVQISEHLRKQTLAKWLPVFDLTYSWSWSSAGGFSGSNANWLLTFGARWDLFLGGSRIVEGQSRRSETRTAKLNVEQVILQIGREVEENYLNVENRKGKVEVIEKQATLAKRNHDMVSRQFEAGIISSLDVVEATTTLARKRILRVFERLQYDLAVLTLRKSLGEYAASALIRAQ